MQGHINGLPGSRGVLAEKATERIKCRGRICVQQGVAQPGLAHFANGQVLSLVAGVTEAHFPVPRLEVIPNFSLLGPVSLRPRNRTPVVIGIGVPLMTRVVSPTVKGLNGFWIGTLIPVGLKNELVPGAWNGSGVNGTAASDASKYDRAYLKSANIVRYLSHRSRVNEP